MARMYPSNMPRCVNRRRSRRSRSVSITNSCLLTNVAGSGSLYKEFLRFAQVMTLLMVNFLAGGGLHRHRPVQGRARAPGLGKAHRRQLLDDLAECLLPLAV